MRIGYVIRGSNVYSSQNMGVDYVFPKTEVLNICPPKNTVFECVSLQNMGVKYLTPKYRC